MLCIYLIYEYWEKYIFDKVNDVRFCFQLPQDEVNERHEEYLINLQLKNRAIKKLQQKDRKTIEKEQQEQGFSLYVNGANETIAQRRNKEHKQRHHLKSRKKDRSKTPGKLFAKSSIARFIKVVS